MPVDRNALVADIRRFSRFYTGLVGLLDETLMHSPYTLTEARVLFELGRRPTSAAAHRSGKAGFLARAFGLDLGPAVSEIARELRLDPAYVTKIPRKFAAAGLIQLRADPDDRRRRILSLTARGDTVLAGLQAAADRDLARLTVGLADDEAAALSAALEKAARLLGGARASGPGEAL
ncbi:MarR family winged helix-turn-helix transcriptional regulator [Mesorhizobium sp. M0488]|uniref:MarR family winged helix-turn-helix transcriptional regulator n=1 Tax=unclassified Mesorhizobium TaxID=325217 RepID=UPI00333D57F7